MNTSSVVNFARCNNNVDDYENNLSLSLDDSRTTSSGAEDGNNNTGRSRAPKKFSFGLTNARSLWNKIYSLYDSFDELDLAVTVVTETWFHKCPALEKLETDALHGNDLGSISYMRKINGNKNRGGGVSIFYNKNKITCRKYSVKTNAREIVVARGKMVDNSRPFFIVGVYISTRLKPREMAGYIENICHILLKIKTENADPYIIIAGDFNGADSSPIMADFPDLVCKSGIATRERAALDYSITNFDDEIELISARRPLENYATGVQSDHSFLHYQAALSHVHKFEWIRNTVRDMKPANIERIVTKINTTVWGDVLPTLSDPDLYVQKFHELIMRMCDEELPWKEVKRRSTDDPWITEEIARKVRKRKAIFRRENRSRKWKKMKRLTDDLIKKARKKYYRREVEKMKNPGTLPFQAIKGMKDKERPPSWALSDLFPGKALHIVREEAAEYFNRISAEFKPLTDADLPITRDREVRMLTVAEISEGLQALRKPKSYVSIDLPPAVLNRCCDSLAVAVAPVINLTRSSGWWPTLWKAEEVTIIPKCLHPASLDQTRNISCTSVFSKLAESYLLERLNREVELPQEQFGGKQGMGTEHLLAELTTDLMSGLDTGLSCATVMSLDFAKAFNRMSHPHCLASLARMGASNQTLATVFAFLKQRTMRIKFNNGFSSPRECNGGAPQGTKTGGFLFAATVASLNNSRETDLSETGPESTFNMSLVSSDEEHQRRYDDTEDFSFNVAQYDRRRNPCSNPLDETPAHPYLDFWDGARIEQEIDGTGRDREGRIKGYNYVDDQTLVEFTPIKNAVSSITTSKEARHVHAQGLSDEYQRTDRWASSIGMRLNLNKTQLLCISDSKNYSLDTYLRVGNQIIEGQQELKILGYYLNNKPDASAQYGAIRRNAAARAWSLRHLKRSGVGNRDLVQIYTAFVRSVVEYASNVYGGFLTESQKTGIERIQELALQSIFGTYGNYHDNLIKAGIPTLEERRRLLFLRFAGKVEKSATFSKKWLKPADPSGHDLRRADKYKVERARTERLRRAPIPRIRSALNEISRENKTVEDAIGELEKRLAEKYLPKEDHMTESRD